MDKKQLDEAHGFYMKIYTQLAADRKSGDIDLLSGLKEELRVAASIAAQDIKLNIPLRARSEFQEEVERLLS